MSFLLNRRLGDFARELDFDQLLAVNGGCGGSFTGNSGYTGGGENHGYNSYGSGSSGSSSSGSGSCSGSGGYSGGSSSSGSESCSGSGGYSGGSSSTSSSSGTCSGTSVTPTEIAQRSFSTKYGSEFGDNACAATSLLNEISEEYTAVTGKTMTASQAVQAMAAAVQAGNVDSTNAYVSDWAAAADSMAESLGLSGSYTYTTDANKADAVIYAIDKNGDGVTDHFVNFCGNGSYYDPWTEKTGSVSELYTKSEYTITTRYLDYKK